MGFGGLGGLAARAPQPPAFLFWLRLSCWAGLAVGSGMSMSLGKSEKSKTPQLFSTRHATSTGVGSVVFTGAGTIQERLIAVTKVSGTGPFAAGPAGAANKWGCASKAAMWAGLARAGALRAEERARRSWLADSGLPKTSLT